MINLGVVLIDVHGINFELVEDAAPEQFADPKDAMMVYSIYVNGELLCATDEGTPVHDMVKVCDSAIQFFREARKLLKKKKQVGKRCT